MPSNKATIHDAVETLLATRRAARVSSPEARRQLADVAAYFHRLIGPTVSRADAARLLGISRPSLDRWIEKNDIAAVRTPQGRVGIPLAHLLGLIEEVERQGAEHGSHALAKTIRDRRSRAAAIDDDEILPPRRPRARTHREPELQSLAYHRLLAARLDEDVVGRARERLRVWLADGRLDPYWADQWEAILDRPLDEIARAISARTARARELRQTSPFAGELTEQERRRVLEAVEERAS